MQRNIKNRALAIAVFAAFAVSAIAIQSTAALSGRLSADHYREHSYTMGTGSWTVELVNKQPGDLDVEVYDEAGNLLCEDTLADNFPMCTFRNRKTQEITIRVINASEARSARYLGIIE